MAWTKHALALVTLGTSGIALAQSGGSLIYGPMAAVGAGAGATPVPIASLFLLPLAIVMTFLGYRALRKQDGRQLLGSALLASGVSLGGMSSLHIQDAFAALMIELNQPEGGTVDIPVTDAIYINTSGVALQIGSVTSPPSCVTSAPADECVTNLTLEDGESCSTVYDCAQTIAFTSKAPTDATVGGATYSVAATSTSGLPVAFSTASAGCSVSGSTVTFEAAGDCVINANQDGDADFAPAPQAQQAVTASLPVVTVTKAGDGAERMIPTNASFMVARTGDTATPLTVTYALSGTAEVIDDYTVASETSIEIPVNQSSVELLVTVLDDEVYDPSETVIVAVSADASYTVGLENSAEAEITASDKRFFATASSYDGNLGGISGADAKCESDANKPASGTYKAVLAGAGRQATPTPTDWVLQPNSKYFRLDGTFIAGTQGAAIFEGDLSNSVAAVPEAVVWAWTGLREDWSTTLNCSDWESEQNSNAGISGDAGATSLFFTLQRLNVPCDRFGIEAGALYCAEQ
jgi:uncharacterized protein DUF1554